jgi:hypothetical protein
MNANSPIDRADQKGRVQAPTQVNLRDNALTWPRRRNEAQPTSLFLENSATFRKIRKARPWPSLEGGL